MAEIDGKAQPMVFFSEQLSWYEVKSAKGSRFFTEGYITTGDRDLVDDIVTKRCMDSMQAQLTDRSIKVDVEHETLIGKTNIERETAKTKIPIAKFIENRHDEKGIWTKAELNQHHPRFKETWGSIKEGFLDAHSIAFIPTEARNAMIDGKDTRLLDDLTLLNVAYTGNAINPNATMGPVMAKAIMNLRDYQHNIKSSESSFDNSRQEEIKEMEMETKNKETNPTENLTEVKNELLARLDKTDERIAALEKKADDEPADKPAEKPADEAGETEPAETVEAKAKAEADAKALVTSVEKLTAEVKSLKEQLDRPEYKAMQTKMKEQLEGAEGKSDKKELNPLDRI